MTMFNKTTTRRHIREIKKCGGKDSDEQEIISFLENTVETTQIFCLLEGEYFADFVAMYRKYGDVIRDIAALYFAQGSPTFCSESQMELKQSYWRFQFAEVAMEAEEQINLDNEKKGKKDDSENV